MGVERTKFDDIYPKRKSEQKMKRERAGNGDK